MTLRPIPPFNKGIYQHYNGQYYEVIDGARHSETLEFLIIYKALYGENDIWVRPFEMFFETIEHNGQTRPRFEFINNQTGEGFLNQSGLKENA